MINGKDNNFILVTKNAIPQRLYLNGKELPGVMNARVVVEPNALTSIVVEFHVDNVQTMELEPKP